MIYESGDVRVDVGRMTAARGDTPISLEPKAFDVLVYLIERRDRLVTKDELLEAVWRDTFVTPNVLTRAVAQIRKGLGDEAQDARYIETLAKRGYRFIAPVAIRQPAEPAPPASSGHRLWLAFAAVAIVGLAVFLLYNKKVEPAAPSVNANPELRRLTNRRGYNGHPSLSPDGRAVVYSSDSTGAIELYVTGMATGSNEQALTSDGGQNMQPAWSPDGQWIAFHSRKRGGVWIVPATGGTPRQVTEFGSDPGWAPDSDTIVFTSDAGGMWQQSVLWTARRDGTARRQITQLGKPAGGHRAPAFSHTGRQVAFVLASGGTMGQIWTTDIESGALRHIADTLSAADPSFGPGDRAVYWGGLSGGFNARLFRRALGADGEPAGVEEVVTSLSSGMVDGISLAANGMAAFGVHALDANLWSIEVGANGHASDPVRITDDVAWNSHPKYSDEGRVAYVQVSAGSPPSTWVVRDDGSDKTPLLAGTAIVNPQWDLAHGRILVVRMVEDRGEFAWIDAASRRLTPAGLPLGNMLSPELSPDGRRLAFHTIDTDGVMNVWTGTFDGARVKITADREAISHPDWSPDGKWLAVEIKRGDRTHIGVVSKDGGPVTQLTDDRGQSWPQSWAPDNDRIAFAGERDGVWNVYTVSRTTRAVTALTKFASASGYVRYPSWPAKGSRVVFERGLNTGTVWTMTVPRDRY